MLKKFFGIIFGVSLLVTLHAIPASAFPPGMAGGEVEDEAEEGEEAPHAGMGMPEGSTGKIIGEVFAEEGGAKKPLPSQELTIIVLKDKVQVLTLEKKADQKGHFEFKNIFKDPTFRYMVGTKYGNQFYMVRDIHLEEGKDVAEVKFQVGDGSPYSMGVIPSEGENPGQMPEPRGNMSPDGGKAGAIPMEEEAFKKMALVLLAVGVVVALFYAVSKKRRLPPKE